MGKLYCNYEVYRWIDWKTGNTWYQYMGKWKTRIRSDADTDADTDADANTDTNQNSFFSPLQCTV